jgi:hypothetical protein
LVAINARSVATPHQLHERERAEAYGTERRPFPYDFRKYRQGILRAAEFLTFARGLEVSDPSARSTQSGNESGYRVPTMNSRGKGSSTVPSGRAG